MYAGLAGAVDERGGSLWDERRCHMVVKSNEQYGFAVQAISTCLVRIYIDSEDRAANRGRIFSSIFP